MMETQVCNSCNKELPATLEYFYWSQYKKNHLYGHCKECHKVRQDETRKLKEVIVIKEDKEDVTPDLRPEYKRYADGKLDLVLCSSRGKLYKTMDYRTFTKQHPDKQIETIEI